MTQPRLAMLAAILLAAQWSINMRLKTMDTAWVEPPPGLGSQWNPELFKALSFGFTTSAVDCLWLKTLQDMTLTKVPAGMHPAVYYDLDLATDLDPAYFEAYTNGANILTIIRGDAEGGKALLLKAEKFRKEELPGYPEFFRKEFWSGSWYPSFVLAYIYLFELNDLPNASLAFQEATRIEGSPLYIKHLTERLMKKGGQYEVGLNLLAFMIDSARQPDVKEGLVRKRESLMVSQYLFNANDTFRFYLNSLPSYRKESQVSHDKLESYWRAFLKEQNFPSQDPWGGRLSLSDDGRVITSTPHERVLGLE
jgi:hypothetical protein